MRLSQELHSQHACKECSAACTARLQGMLCNKQPAKLSKDQQQGSLQRSTDKQSIKAAPDTCLHKLWQSLPVEPDSLMRNQTCFLKCWKRDSASAAALGDAMRSNSCLTGLNVCPNTPCNHNRNINATWHATLAVTNIGCCSPCTVLQRAELHTSQRGVHTSQGVHKKEQEALQGIASGFSKLQSILRKSKGQLKRHARHAKSHHT